MSEIYVVLSSLFYDMDNLLRALIILMALDFVTGVTKSFMGKSEKSKNGFISSTTLWNGGIKKVVTLVIVAVSGVLNSLMIPETALVQSAVVIYYISVEALSIIENAAVCGIPIPNKILEVLETLRDEN